MIKKQATLQEIVGELGHDKAALLPILLAVQDASPQNYVSEEAVNEIAYILNVSRSRVYSTASFYSEISLKPRGRHIVRICVNAPCEDGGKEKILQALETELGVTMGETTTDSIFTLEGVSCLGACYMSPAMKIDDKLFGNLTPESAVRIIQKLRAGEKLNRQPSVSKKDMVFNLNCCCNQTELMNYQQQGGYQAFQKTLHSDSRQLISEITLAGLRGRGGAAFSTGTKLKMVHENEEKERFIVCNADEGEPGTFKDRFIMTHIPFQLLEGLTIAAYLAGASKGYIYIRHEYPEAQQTMRASIIAAQEVGLLGNNILGSDFSFQLEIFCGAGSYLCGEETALLSSIEGKKGRPRVKPPYPTKSGLWGKPTLIHNVETLANIPAIIARGAAWYRNLGTEDSPGTKLISLSGDVNQRGLYEVPFGMTFREIIEIYGKGMKAGKNIKAANIGGASGVVVPPWELDCPMEYGKCAEKGITIGSGAIFVLDETRSILANVRNRANFFLHESCGKCTPCREGLRQVNRIIAKIISGTGMLADVENLERYTRTMQQAAFCGLGQAAGNSLISSLAYFRNEYEIKCNDYKSTSTKGETA
jgi:NADH-quinone oxidoreductase subunit F